MLIGQTEEYTMKYPYIAAWENELSTPLAERFRNKEAGLENEALKAAFGSIYLEVYNKKEPGVSSDGVPYMFDLDHVSVYGASLLGKKISKELFGK